MVEGKYWITDHALKVDKISNDVTYEYLEIALSLIDIGRFRVVSAQPSISQSVILGLTIPLPTLTEQNKIVRVIDSYRKIEEDILTSSEKIKQIEKMNYIFFSVILVLVCHIRSDSVNCLLFHYAYHYSSDYCACKTNISKI